MLFLFTILCYFQVPVPSNGDATTHPGEVARATCLKTRTPMSVRLRADTSLVYADVKRTQIPPVGVILTFILLRLI